MKTYIPSRLLSLVAGAIALTCTPFSGSAQTLFNVDAGTGSSPTYTGAAVLGSSGDLWNGITGPDWGDFITAISDSTGSFAAGATIRVWNYAFKSDNSAGTTANPMGLMQDYITSPGWGAGDGWPIKVELANLPVSTAFNLVVYSAGDAAGQGGTISLATDSTFGTILASATTTAASRDISTGPGVAYQVFSGTTSASGTIDFQITTTTDNWHAFNGLQLQVVPEPSTAALGILGTALLGWYRRSRA